MFELLVLFLMIVGFVVMLKVGAVVLHLLFIPFQIVGGLFIALLAAPFLSIMLPLLLVGIAVAGFLIFGLVAGTAGGALCYFL